MGGSTPASTCVRLQLCAWLQQPDDLATIHHDADLSWVQFFLLICFISPLFDCVTESQCWLCKYYNAYVSTETPIFYFFSNLKQFYLFLI